MKKTIMLLLLISLLAVISMGCAKDDKGDDVTDVNTEAGVTNAEEVDGDTQSEEEVKELEYVIYVRQKSLPVLFAEKYTIPGNDPRFEEMTIEEIALEQLISFEPVEDVVSPVPEGTEVLSMVKKDGNIYVDLSKKFLDNMPEDKISTNMAISAIVNTLTIFEEDSKVFFTIEGNEIQKLNGVNMEQGFEFDDGFFADK